MSERQLATIQRIESLDQIDGADNLLAAKMVDKGWQIVVNKKDFKPGDPCIFFEVDSFLPTKPEFEFLRKQCLRTQDGKEGFRLKTIKLRKTLSQGLLMPLSILPEGITPEVGLDVTDALGVVKYDVESHTSNPGVRCGFAKGNFPHWISKTDEERIQNLGGKHRIKLDSTLFHKTEKLDGSSFTAYVLKFDETTENKDTTFGVCSRNYELKPDGGGSFWEAAVKLDLENKLRTYVADKEFIFNLVIQGELIGPGVCTNHYKLAERTVKFFGAYKNGRKMDHWNMTKLFNELGLETVPLLSLMDYTYGKTMDDILADAEGPSQLNPDVEREGVVWRALDGSVSFKAISNKYLLGEK